MPTYVCTTTEGRIDASGKTRLAEALTRIHAEVTGAPGYYVQVIFEEVKPERWFVGGKPLAHDHAFIYGRIRAGRAAVDKMALAKAMAAAAAEIFGCPPAGVWVYIAELPARQMIEFGHVLPEPGDEAAWTAALPAADREFMQRIGR